MAEPREGADTPTSKKNGGETPVVETSSVEGGDKVETEQAANPAAVAADNTGVKSKVGGDKIPFTNAVGATNAGAAADLEADVAPAPAANNTGTANATATQTDETPKEESVAVQNNQPTAPADDEELGADGKPVRKINLSNVTPPANADGTEEEAKEDKGPASENPAPANNVQQPAAQTSQDREEGERSFKGGDTPSAFMQQFESRGFHNKIAKYWQNINEIPQFYDAIGQNGEVKESSYGLDMWLDKGGKIEWHQNLRGSGVEFIGMTRGTSKFNEDSAFGVVAAARAHGWKSINVHGNEDQKDMLWLQAQLQGLPVTNHKPLPGSAIWDEYNKKMKKNMEQTPGVTNTDAGLPNIRDTAPADSPNAVPLDQAAKDDKAAGKPAAMTAPETVETAETSAAADKATPASAIAGKNLGDMKTANAAAPEATGDDAFLEYIKKNHPDQASDIEAKLKGEKPPIENLDPKLVKELDEQGFTQHKAIDGTAAVDGAKPAADKAIPASNLTLEQQFDRVMANPGTTDEVKDGLKEIAKQIADKNITTEQLSGLKVGGDDGKLDAAGLKEFKTAFEAKIAAPVEAMPKAKPVTVAGPVA